MTATEQGSVLRLTYEDAETAINQSIGFASMCWRPAPRGEFDSEKASRIADELTTHLRRLRLLPDEDASVSDETLAELVETGNTRERLLDGARRILEGDTETAGGSADLDYGHDIITETLLEVAKRARGYRS